MITAFSVCSLTDVAFLSCFLCPLVPLFCFFGIAVRRWLGYNSQLDWLTQATEDNRVPN